MILVDFGLWIARRTPSERIRASAKCGLLLKSLDIEANESVTRVNRVAGTPQANSFAHVLNHIVARKYPDNSLLILDEHRGIPFCSHHFYDIINV